MTRPFLLGLLFLASGMVMAEEKTIGIDDFENGLSPYWEAKRFKGETTYRVVEEGSNHVLRAESHASASGVIYKYSYSVKDYPLLTWRWKVGNIIEKGDETKKSGDDYAGRVYVIFPHWLPPLSRSINYIWANKLPKGKYVRNPFHAKAVMVAVESGSANVGKWIKEQRNVYEDFKMIFGGEPPTAGAVAIMTDTDNTGESATAYYDDIRIERE
ncbi:MAG: DUF3047 domain-containing protein [bacterium]